MGIVTLSAVSGGDLVVYAGLVCVAVLGVLACMIAGDRGEV